jgi:hypothetical protein
VEFIHQVARTLKLGWLASPAGVKVVATGLVATIFSLIVFTNEDIWFQFTGDAGVFADREYLYLPMAALSAVFCLVSFFMARRGLPRIAYAIFCVAMASHVFLRFAAIPLPQMKVIAISRVFASLDLVFLYSSFRSKVGDH